ncbi:MAG: PilZ domain-containing protein [Deltaproteobacteria bacterium]|nr:PilZ domain-containing protein [Deltaproteobacteria bacterium]
MIYQRYLKTGKSVLLKSLEQNNDGRTELLSATIDGGDEDTLIISLPYSEDAVEQYPFAAGMAFEISSEAMGLGIRVTGQFEKKIDGKRLALKLNSDLQMFQRRNRPRLDCKIGIRFTRGQGTLKALRNTWEKNIQLLHGPEAPLIFEGFNPCQVNLSSGGIRFNLRPPASRAELCLILINLDDGKVPICALAEIVWVRPENNETIIVAGMRFINILEQDQQRIDDYIKHGTR